MPNPARHLAPLPSRPSDADLAECASRRPPITYQQLLAERGGSRLPGNPPPRTLAPLWAGDGYAEVTQPTIARPISITLPWSALLPDNNRNAIVGGRLMRTKEYKLAKTRATESIENQVPGGHFPFTAPVALRVVLIEPNRSAKRDLLNYQKLICDAMTGLVYLDDSLIDDAHFTRGTPDIDRPRAEITVAPIGAKP